MRDIVAQTRGALGQLRNRILGNSYLRLREAPITAPARVDGIRRETRGFMQGVLERGIESGARGARAFTRSNFFRTRIAPAFAVNEARVKMAIGETETRRELPPEELRRYHESLLHPPGQPDTDRQMFEYVRGSGPEPRRLVVLVMGNRQGFTSPDNGMRELQRRFAGQPDVDVLLFRSGQAARDFRAATSQNTGLDGNTAVNMRHIENLVHDRIHCRGMFSGERPPSSMSMGGFSFGGGAIEELSDRWTQMNTQIPVTGVALIDPIRLGIQHLGAPVTRRPAMAGRVLHFYQDSNLSRRPGTSERGRRSIGVHGAPLADVRPGDSVRLIRGAGHREIQTAALHNADVLDPAFRLLNGQQS